MKGLNSRIIGVEIFLDSMIPWHVLQIKLQAISTVPTARSGNPSPHDQTAILSIFESTIKQGSMGSSSDASLAALCIADLFDFAMRFVSHPSFTDALSSF